MQLTLITFLLFSEVLMECYLDRWVLAQSVLMACTIIMDSTNAVVMCQSGPSVHTLPQNLSALRRSGKFQMEQRMLTLQRYA